VVCASGSLPKGISIDFYYKLIETATAKGVPFILDTSGEALIRGIKGKPYMIKPNLEELQKLFGFDCTTLDEQAKAVRKLKDSGIAMPCLTLGKMGCVVALAEGIFHFFGPSLEVVNTVGSGDSFVAGCAVGVARGMEAMDIIKLGMACGMANTQFLKTGMVSKELVSKYFKQIEYHVIK
jgi:1-phosphofructokinase family hexose kinase